MIEKLNVKLHGQIDIKDVETFSLSHKMMQNGLVLFVKIKKELCSFYSSTHPERDEYGTVERKYIGQYFEIRAKDEPIFRKKIYNWICKHGKMINMPMNGVTVQKKELSGEQVFKLINGGDEE